ncbi:MAG: hypothetical protein O2901_10260 [Verrucomicrobia bacterium]|nr:hypothetical protein [Verrucomicrobiota bacterium]
MSNNKTGSGTRGKTELGSYAINSRTFHYFGIYLIVAALIVATSGVPAAAAPKRGWLRRTMTKPSWSQAVAECTTPQDVCRMVQRHIVYTEEDGDTWSAADDTWDGGTGDCEDFAILAQELCLELGFEASVQLYYATAPKFTGHAVAIGSWGDKMWVSSNGTYKEFDSQEGVQKHVASILRCKQKNMFTILLADHDVQSRIKGGLEQAIAATTPATPADHVNRPGI